MVLHEQLRRSAQEEQKVDLINILIFSHGSLFENTLSFEKSTYPTSDHFVNKIEENLYSRPARNFWGKKCQTLQWSLS